MSSDALLYAGIAFSVAVAGFLLGCLIVALLTETTHDPLGDTPHGDWPAIPTDLKVSRFHNRGDTK